MKRMLLLAVVWLGWIPTASAQYEKSPLRETVMFSDSTGGMDTLQVWIDEGIKFHGESIGWSNTQIILKRDLIDIYKDVWPSEYESMRTAREAKDRTFIPMPTRELLLIRINIMGVFSDEHRYSFLKDPSEKLMVTLQDRRVLIAEPARDLGRKESVSSERLARAQPQLRRWCKGRELLTTAELQQIWPSLDVVGKVPESCNEFVVFIPNGGRSFNFHDIMSVRMMIGGREVTLSRHSNNRSQAALER